MADRTIQIIANPGAGQEGLNLKTVQRILASYPVIWDLAITRQAGDARRLARAAAEAGANVVAIFGGDGSVAEAAAGLAGSGVPLAILPGGTANVMAAELGVPGNLEEALQVAGDPESRIRAVDMGLANDRHFILRVGMGLEAAMVEGADRTAKDRFGIFAYLWSAMQNLAQPTPAEYHLTVDGETYNATGLTCIVANSGNMGQAGLNLIPTIKVDDGLLDVVVLSQAGLKAFFDVAGAMLGIAQIEPEQRRARYRTLGEEMRKTIQYWQGKAVTVESKPRQSVQSDGELLEEDRLHCRVLPQALRVVLPKAS